MSDEKGHVGSRFDDFLEAEGIRGEASEAAAKRVIAWQLTQVMREQGISKLDMAKRLQTSRAQLDRLLDPDNDSVTLGTLMRAARAVGRTLRVELA